MSDRVEELVDDVRKIEAHLRRMLPKGIPADHPLVALGIRHEGELLDIAYKLATIARELRQEKDAAEWKMRWLAEQLSVYDNGDEKHLIAANAAYDAVKEEK